MTIIGGHMPIKVPQYGRDEYRITQGVHAGVPAETGDDIVPAAGLFALVGIHLTDDQDEFMREMAGPAEAICAALRERLARIVLLNQKGIPPPPVLAAHPEAFCFDDLEVFGADWDVALRGQRRIIVTGWDARACVSQLLANIADKLPRDGRSELHFPFGALDDAALEIEGKAPVISLSLLLRIYAERIASLRGASDVKFNGTYLGRHGRGDAKTALHFYSSAEEFIRLQAPKDEA